MNKVLGQGKTTYQPVPISFNRAGSEHLWKHISSRFEEDLGALLHRAGYEGAVRVQAIRQATGTTHTKGLRLRNPESGGVAVTWHEGGNDNCFALRVYPPRRKASQDSAEDPMEFHRRLKEVLEASPDQQPGPVATAPAEAEASSAASPAGKRFVDNLEDVELFMMEVREGASPPHWVVHASACSKALLEFDSRYTPKAVEHILGTLVEKKHLARGSERGTFIIGEQWRTATSPEASSEAGETEPGAAPAGPVESAVLAGNVSGITAPSAAEGVTQPTAPRPKSGEALSVRLEKLEALAGQASQLAIRREWLAMEIAGLDQQIQTYTSQRDARKRELATVDRELEKPEVRDAAARFAQVSALLS